MHGHGVSQQGKRGEIMRLLLVCCAGILLVLGLSGSGAFAAPKESCDNSSISGGSHGSITVTGFCGAEGAITIDGNLTVADGAIFAPVDDEFNLWPVHVTGSIKVGKGAQLLLGWDASEGELGADVVDGNIVANQPLSLYIGNVTVHGNVVSNGGGTSERFFNFPIKDNKIDGNLVIHGWTGGWWGVIANAVGGNVDLSNNRSVVVPANEQECEGTFPMGCDATPGVDEDSSEVQSRYIPEGAFGPGEPPVTVDNPQHISGNLICHGNTPSAQFNPLDGGAANIVDGKKIGECAGL
jgi:hypothetical protein